MARKKTSWRILSELSMVHVLIAATFHYPVDNINSFVYKRVDTLSVPLKFPVIHDRRFFSCIALQKRAKKSCTGPFKLLF